MGAEKFEGARYFKFDSRWAKESDCLDVIQSCWRNPTSDNPYRDWYGNLNRCKYALL